MYRQRITLWSWFLVACVATRLEAQLALAEIGGSHTEANLARQEGALAFALDELDLGVHFTANLNDGLYGNANSWIGNTGSPGFAGIRLVDRLTVASIAFGRDNQEVPQFNDRYAGVYTLQVTSVDNPDALTPDSDWTTVGAIENGTFCPPRPWMRHRYNFDPVEATAIRLLVPATGLPLGTAIDELEVYAEAGDLVAEPCAPPPPELALLQTGGPGETPAQQAADVSTVEEGNLARAPGAVPFATTPHPAPIHQTPGLNDGLYGNSQSWLGNEPGPASNKVYAGIYFTGGLKTLEEIALGRDNLGQLPDRAQGAYLIEITTAEFDWTDDSATDVAPWTTLGVATAHLADGQPGLRHLYGFAPVEVRALRVLTALGNAIDEIELGGKLSAIDRDPTPPPPPLPDMTLVEVGGTLAVGNLAMGPAAFAFALDSLVGFPIHDISHLNDGLHGNSQSWIGESGNPGFAGISLGGRFTVRSIAFGRDNQEIPEFNDRYLGHYVLEITTAENPSELTPDAAWTGVADVTIDAFCPPRPWMRHRYNFEAVEATGIRLLVPNTGIALGTAIDELEVYSEAGAALADPCGPPALLEHVTTGGPVTTPAQAVDVPAADAGNVARAPTAVAFGTPPFPDPAHTIPHLNDGLYGNAQSWLGNELGPASGKAYAGIYFTGGLQSVRGVALGRDNTGQFLDRAAGPYLVQYTQDELDPADDASIDGARWITIGQAAAHLSDGTAGLRHQYAFPAITARAVRVVTELGNAIDELELSGDAVVPPGTPFHRGDADDNGSLQLTDAVRILGYLFLGQAAPPCLEAADTDNNGDLQLTDAVRILGYLFLGQAAPVTPGPPPAACGLDPEGTGDLGCATYVSC